MRRDTLGQGYGAAERWSHFGELLLFLKKSAWQGIEFRSIMLDAIAGGEYQNQTLSFLKGRP
jgi:hypothetical protein